jgi:Tol biopolymer transport system component
MTSRLTAVLASTFVCLLAVASSAHAAFPGANGKIAFATYRDSSYEIYTINADGSNQTRLTNNTADDVYPAWSPNGTKIAFATGTGSDGGYPYDIYTMNTDGTGPTRLTNNTGSNGEPAWSPDGSKIAFDTNRDGNYEIYTMNVDGTNQTRLTNDPASNFSPDWQPLPGPQRGDYKNAEEFCRAERDFLGAAAFRHKYGTGPKGSNAFGKCVSSK